MHRKFVADVLKSANRDRTRWTLSSHECDSCRLDTGLLTMFGLNVIFTRNMHHISCFLSDVLTLKCRGQDSFRIAMNELSMEKLCAGIGWLYVKACAGWRVRLKFPFEHHTQKCPLTSKAHQSSHPDAGLWIVSVFFIWNSWTCQSALFSDARTCSTFISSTKWAANWEALQQVERGEGRGGSAATDVGVCTG